jgi:repressor LexA
MSHLKALEKKGLIRRALNMSRAIEPLSDPVSARPASMKLVGRFAAGQPLENVDMSEEFDFSEWENAPDKFALRVSGDSMIDEHVADGDFVVCRKAEQARDGQIVALRNDDGEATLRPFFVRGTASASNRPTRR